MKIDLKDFEQNFVSHTFREECWKYIESNGGNMLNLMLLVHINANNEVENSTKYDKYEFLTKFYVHSPTFGRLFPSWVWKCKRFTNTQFFW